MGWYEELHRSLYTLYKQSQNPYYPLAEDKISWDIVKNNPASHEKLNFYFLEF